MTSKKKKIIIIGIVAVIVIIAIFIKINGKKQTFEGTTNLIAPERGSITIYISTTGTVLPNNRLEIKPAVNGRIESILVVEGQRVKKGQVLMWMSSTDRAALIDAARMQGGDAVKYWEDAYKPIPLSSPINGTVIVRAKEPGQTIVSSDAVLVLSDMLVVKADVDETDIGRVKLGQKAKISLDAHPDVQADGTVSHISYESKTTNNVTTYEVDITIPRMPNVFRSGMSANINIIEKVKNNILLLPVEAVKIDNQNSIVMVKDKGGKPIERIVETGITDDKNVEVISGLTEEDKVILSQKKYVPTEKGSKGQSPFQPARKK